MTCVKALCELMKQNNDHIEDKCYNNVSEILASGINRSSFIGHCCEIKEAIKKEKKIRLSVLNLLVTDMMDTYIYHNFMYYLIHR